MISTFETPKSRMGIVAGRVECMGSVVMCFCEKFTCFLTNPLSPAPLPRSNRLSAYNFSIDLWFRGKSLEVTPEIIDKNFLGNSSTLEACPLAVTSQMKCLELEMAFRCRAGIYKQLVTRRRFTSINF